MGSGNSKNVNDLEKQNKQRYQVNPRSSHAGPSPRMNLGKSSLSSDMIPRGRQFLLPLAHVESHSKKEIRCMTQESTLITDCIAASSTTSSLYKDTLLQLKKDQSVNKSVATLLFSDTSFPASTESLSRNIQTFEAGRDGLTWKRPSEFPAFSPQSIAVFVEGIKPTDILQGGLGDCYLLSALSSMAEKPGMIERLFESKDVSVAGVYCVWLCHDGEWKQVVVDDCFPCTPPNEGPAFSRTNNNELWAMILEKAYAKIYGTYQKIEGGLAGHAIRDLTGAPYHYFVRDNAHDYDSNSLWEYISKHTTNNNYIVTASSESNTRDAKNSKGIISNHSYSILDAREVVDSSGKRDRIIKIRNPWGEFEWKGDWCDESTRWTGRVAAEVGLTSTNDGIFWMSVNDFTTQFSQLMTSKIQDIFKYTSLRASKAPPTEKLTQRLFTMKVSTRMQSGACHIGVTQKDQRNFAGEKKFSSYNYSLTRIILASLDSQQGGSVISRFLAGEMDCDRDMQVSLDTPLEPGVYLLYIEVDWSEIFAEVRDFVVWCYGEQPVEFLEVKGLASTSQLIDDLLEAHSEIEDAERTHRYNDQIARTSGSTTGYVYYFYQNNSADVHLREEINMKSSQHLDAMMTTESSRGSSGVLQVRTAPGERKTVKYRAMKAGRGQFSYSTNVKYILLQQVDARDEEKLMAMALLQPSKVKQREMHGLLMKVFVHTFVYYGGICFLYINKTSNKSYMEDLTLEVNNLRSEAHDLSRVIYIEVPPQQSRLLNLTAINPEADIIYKPKMTYYLQ